jgi:hypothetical protein
MQRGVSETAPGIVSCVRPASANLPMPQSIRTGRMPESSLTIMRLPGLIATCRLDCDGSISCRRFSNLLTGPERNPSGRDRRRVG